MTNETLLKDTQDFIKKFFPVYNLDLGHEQIENTKVGVYINGPDYSYISVKLDERIEYTVSTSAGLSDAGLSIAYAILSTARERTAHLDPVEAEPVEVTLAEIAKLKGIDVKRLKVVDA